MAEAELLEMTGGDPRNPTVALPSRVGFGAGSRTVDVQGPCALPNARKVHEEFWEKL